MLSRCARGPNLLHRLFFTDGQSVVSASGGRTIHVWDTRAGDAIGYLLTGHSELVYAVFVVSSRQQIASGSKDETMRLWNANMREAAYVLECQSRVPSVCFYLAPVLYESGTSKRARLSVICLVATP